MYMSIDWDKLKQGDLIILSNNIYVIHGFNRGVAHGRRYVAARGYKVRKTGFKPNKTVGWLGKRFEHASAYSSTWTKIGSLDIHKPIPEQVLAVLMGWVLRGLPSTNYPEGRVIQSYIQAYNRDNGT